MDDLSCPLTSKYLDSLERRIEQDNLARFKIDRLYYLRELAQCAGSERIRLHQRAFLCVEIMATRGLASSFSLGVPSVWSLRWEKSAVGIAKLLKVLRAEREELIADQTEFLLEQPAVVAGVEQLYNAKAKRQIEYLGYVEESAMLLRRSLRKNFIHTSLSVLGLRLYSVTYLLGVDAQLDIAEELLNQTEHVERRAWEPKIQSPK